MKDIELWHGDCLDLMPKINDASISMAFCDIPYSFVDGENRHVQATNNGWDKPFDVANLWPQLFRVCKKEAAVVFSCTNPFAAFLITSAPRFFRYDLVWEKTASVGFLQSKKRPLRSHEMLLMFSRGATIYNPQKTQGTPYKPRSPTANSIYSHSPGRRTQDCVDGSRYPRSVLRFANKQRGKYHPTQKPLALLRWLIATYSNAGQIILDPTMGSGTTAVAALSLGRRCVGIERDKGYYDIAVDRVRRAMAEPRQAELALPN